MVVCDAGLGYKYEYYITNTTTPTLAHSSDEYLAAQARLIPKKFDIKIVISKDTNYVANDTWAEVGQFTIN